MKKKTTHEKSPGAAACIAALSLTVDISRAVGAAIDEIFIFP